MALYFPGQSHKGLYSAPVNTGGLYQSSVSASSGGSSITFNGLVGLGGTSNAMGAANFNATGQSDSGYGVSDTVGFASAFLIAQWSASITNPVTWSNLSASLRAYAAPPALNVGAEQTLGRRIVELGMHSFPIITKFGLSGATQHTHYITGSTFPNNPSNIHSQMCSYFLAREAELGKTHDVICFFLGENDCSNNTNASATQTDLADIFGGLRTALGRPNQLIYLIICNASTTGSFTSTVRSQQIAYVATDPNCRAIYVDDIALASNPHYGANGYYTIGDRIAHQINKDFFADVPRNRGTGPSPWLEDFGSCVTIASGAYGFPCGGPEARDGDYQFLVITGQATLPAPALSSSAGFVLQGSIDSIFGGTNHRSMTVWKRPVTQTILDANSGSMPNPSLTNGAVPSNGACIFTARGPNKWTSDPVDLFLTGCNNGNNTSLPISGGVAPNANSLALMFMSTPATNSLGPAVVSVTNPSLTGIAQKRFSVVNQTSFIGLAAWTGSLASAGVIPPTTGTMSAAGNNVGCLLLLRP